MLPFPIISNTNEIEEGYIFGYNFSTLTSYGIVDINPVQSITQIDIPVSNVSYTKMVRVTNSTINMTPPDSRFDIGDKDFEFRMVFYLYAGTSYDVLAVLKSVLSGNPPNSMFDVQINDAGLQNRLGVVLGSGSTAADNYLFNITRSDMTSVVNDFIVRRYNGQVSATLNGTPLLVGIYTNPSTNTSLPNTNILQTQYISIGENPGGTAFGEDIGIIDLSLKVGVI